MKRPLGVAILAWITIAMGTSMVLADLYAATLVFPMMAQGSSGSVYSMSLAMSGVGIDQVMMVYGTILAVLAAYGGALIVTGSGALRLRRWSWTLWIVLCVVHILLAVVALVGGLEGVQFWLLSIAATAFAVYYLFTADVKAAFAKTGVGPEAPWPFGSASAWGTYPSSSQHPSAGSGAMQPPPGPAPRQFCGSCGAAVAPGGRFCPKCGRPT